MKRFPTALAFHGLVLRARDPRLLARRFRRALGWPVLKDNAREVVLGAGPELFISIRPFPAGTEGKGSGNSKARSRAEALVQVDEIHLAVEGLAKSRRKVGEDPLGGDSTVLALIPGIDLVLREFRRAPTGQWKRKRRPA